MVQVCSDCGEEQVVQVDHTPDTALHEFLEKHKISKKHSLCLNCDRGTCGFD